MISEIASIATITVFVILTVGFLIATITVSVLLSQKEKENIVLKEEIESGGESGGGGGGETTSSFWVVSGQAAAGSANNIWYSSDGIAWSAATGDTFGDSTYSGGFDVHYSSEQNKWVTVGRDTQPNFKNIVSSDDGISWTGCATDIGNAEECFIQNIYYANNRWYVMGTFTNFYGNDSNIWYSSDLLSWSGDVTGGIFPAFASTCYDIHYNGTDLWVAVGSSGGLGSNIWYSSDGLAWTVHDPGTTPFGTGSGRSIHFADNRWVVVGISSIAGENIWYSDDGISWTVATGSPFATGGGTHIYYSSVDSRWVAAGNGDTNSNIWYSDDNGENWSVTVGNAFGTGEVNDLYYNGVDKWVAVGNGDGVSSTIWYSSDGITWTGATGSLFGSHEGKAVHYANGSWVAVGEGNTNSDHIWTSVDGITWINTIDDYFDNGYGHKVSYGNGVWVASGRFNISISVDIVYYSTDLISWNPIILKENVPITSRNFGRTIDFILYANNEWLLTTKLFSEDDDVNIILKSTDGINYEFLPSVPFLETNTGNGKKVTFENNLWIACGNGDKNNLVNSIDRTVWNYPSNIELFISQNNNEFNNIIYMNDTLFAVGNDGLIYYSFNSESWVLVDGGLNNFDILNMYYNNGIWVAVGNSRFNANNIRYNKASPIFYNDWVAGSGSPFGTGVAKDVLYAVDKWVAVGAHNSTAENIWYSSDAVSWTAVSGPFGVGGTANKIYYTNGILVVVGAHASTAENIYTSVDGVTWSPISGPFGVGGEATDVLFNNDFWVVCGEDGSSAENIWYSTNGTTWTAGTGDPFAVGGRALSIAVKTIVTTE